MLKWTKQQQQDLLLFQSISAQNFPSTPCQTKETIHKTNPSNPAKNRRKTIGNSENNPTTKPSATNNSATATAVLERKRYSTGNCPLSSKIIRNNLKNSNKMPTITTQTLERRLLRRSLDNHLDSDLREHRTNSRHSLTGMHNKENFGVHFMRNSFGNTSLTALHDLSNGKSPRRSTPTDTARRQTNNQLHIKRFNSAINAMEITPTNHSASNNNGTTFSDNFAKDDDITPLSRLRFRNLIKEDSLSSSRMGDVTLDRMLDAIIESARKDTKPKCKHVKLKDKKIEEKIKEKTAKDQQAKEQSAQVPKASEKQVKQLKAKEQKPKHLKAKEQPAKEQFQPGNNEEAPDVLEQSIHEMEVRTPQHLKRQRVVRRKNPKNTEKKNKREQQQHSAAIESTSNATVVKKKTPMPAAEYNYSNDMIGLTLPNGIPSPDTPIFKSSLNPAALLAVDTPTPQAARLELIFTDNHTDRAELVKTIQRCSTPTSVLEEVPSIKRCLSFSCMSDDDDEDDVHYASSNGGQRFKRSSVASSGSSSSANENFSDCSSTQININVRGSVDLAIYNEGGILNVHVIRCRDLQRANGSTALNAYVKVAVSRKADQANDQQIFKRTAVHRHSSRPYFDHRFKFDLRDLHESLQQTNQEENNEGDDEEDRLQLAVWHRDRQLKRSEFLGCISFPLRVLLQQDINGSYKLQKQQCLNKQQASLAVQQQHQQQQHQHPSQNYPNSQQFYYTKLEQQQQLQQQQPLYQNLNPTMAATMIPLRPPSSASTAAASKNDDAVNIDSSMDIPQPMILSKKALHQRDADENLFLRFLELDPPSTDAAAATSGGTPVAGGRRLSNTKPMGRTPFTMTKKLTRTAERGFGFSIVWTHPPRVEKVEPNLSADRCGILPGDYVIFVDKHNVVTMPEADVLNLIRSQGPTLTLEIFRRSGSGAGTSGGGGGGGVGGIGAATNYSATTISTSANINASSQSNATGTMRSNATTLAMNGKSSRMANSGFSLNAAQDDFNSSTTNVKNYVQMQQQPARPSTACSVVTNSSLEAAKRRLNLPQVTFSKESIAPIMDNRRRFLLQLISREQNFMSAIHFGMQRFVQPLLERKDLITPNDHRTLFQNIDELLRISEDVLEQLCHDDQEPQINFASRVYLSKTTAICAAYKKYCNGIKRADCVLVNKSRQAGSEFVHFITEPPVPRKRPDLTMLIHRPLQHFREILKLMQLLASNCHVDTEEQKNFTSVINELQAAYREITVTSGLMEPLGEGRPLLTLQDLESRMVFTKCKPFTLAVQGRQWIFGGDLSRVEGRSVKPYWTLLFSDIIVFAKVSRDRVLFITEEPIPIANIVDSCFHMRKKTTEFRLTVDPNGRMAESPTGYCAPDLTKTPKKGARRKSLVLRAPSLELKAVWQNLLQRQIFLVNAALGSTPLSSPLDSPDVLNTLVPLSDIGMASASIGSIKMSSLDSINLKNQHQQQNNRLTCQVAEQIEKLIDEKCRILNKTGTPKSSALHLANWMKGQLDKQQEQARQQLNRVNQITQDGESHAVQENDQDERITYWTRQQLEKRTKELNLAKETGAFNVKPNFLGKRLSGVDEMSMSCVSASEAALSQISQSHSTTSDSQITVRSSPVVLNKLAVCKHCHKNCQQNNQHKFTDKQQTTNEYEPCPFSPSPPSLQEQQLLEYELNKSASESAVLKCHSLKVQHSQSSPHRCSNVNGNNSNSRASSLTSISSGTMTGDKLLSELESSSKLVTSSHGDGGTMGDTESDVAQLITDDLDQSEETTTDDGGGGGVLGAAENGGNSNAAAGNGSSVFITGGRLGGRGMGGRIGERRGDGGGGRGCTSLRILEEQTQASLHMNGHCSGGSGSGGESDNSRDKHKPEPPPRKFITPTPMPQNAKETQVEHETDQTVKTSITITETAKIYKVSENNNGEKLSPVKAAQPKSPRSPRSPKSPQTPKSTRSSAGSNKSNKQFVPCTCDCKPEDFSTLSPEELELQTCKMLESPKQSPKLSRASSSQQPAESSEERNKFTSSSEEERAEEAVEDPHKHCKCVCDKRPLLSAEQQAEDEADDLSLMLIGLAQLTPAAKLLNMRTPTAPMPTPTIASSYAENGFVPTIAVVPPTPDSVLTKTSTNVWDNTGVHASISTCTATNLLISSVPGQAIIENIPEDSCDESPIDEEPPYRPMTNTLRRYGTMSSLEKLPSEDRQEDTLDDYDDDDDDDVEDVDDDDDEELMDKARADNIELDNEIRVVTRAIYSSEDSEDASASGSSGAAWTSRASTFVSGKMSFFEESRAFLDKYLGRWNQDTTSTELPATSGITSDPEEQMDECTSGATSGEEIWGTPTSGGDNDDMHLANSENTHSSPTKSSNSLNDDDDTELMMDELLMAPPMSASTIRGLLPRRRLEPLFEEETESDEEKTQQESEELKKGETTTNGHYLEDSEAGSSSEEEEEEEYQLNSADYDEEDEEEPTSSTEERIQPNLQTIILGPRPLQHPMCQMVTATTTTMAIATTAAASQPAVQAQHGMNNFSQPITIASMLLPLDVLKASSCEYLLDQRLPTTAIRGEMTTTMLMPSSSSSSQRAMIAIQPENIDTTMTMTPLISMPKTMMTTATMMKWDMQSTTTQTTQQKMLMSKSATNVTATTTTTTTTKMMMMKSCSTMVSLQSSSPTTVHSMTSITTSSAKDTISKDKDVSSSSSSISKPLASTTSEKKGKRPATFIPPPPPPRRLLLTQTNLKTSGGTVKTQQAKQHLPPQNSGVSADSGFSAAATAGADVEDISRPAIHLQNIVEQEATVRRISLKKNTTVQTRMTSSSSSTNPAAISIYSEGKQKPTAATTLQCTPTTPTTIIETSLLAGSRISNSPQHSRQQRDSTLSATALKMKQKTGDQRPVSQEQQQKRNDVNPLQAEQHSRLACMEAQKDPGLVLSPRLEMRLALNQDIMGDEDLISYDPGPEMLTILGQDLCISQRPTARDLLSRSASHHRVQPKEAVISYSQQRNSKMDTPTVNRKPRPQQSISPVQAAAVPPTNSATSSSNSNSIPVQATALSMPFVGSARVAEIPQHLQPNRNTWSNSASVVPSSVVHANDADNSKNISCNRDESCLSDLEILARREKIYCMSQLKSGSQARTMMTSTSATASETMMRSSSSWTNPAEQQMTMMMRTTSITSMAGVTERATKSQQSTPQMGQRQRKIGRDETALMEAGKANKLINFIKRRNSEIPSTANNSQTSLNDSNSSSNTPPQHKQAMPMSPRKDNDKPSLNRRLWKQITKRRRSNSVSEIVAT